MSAPGYHDPRCVWRCVLWSAVTALALLVALVSCGAQACDYTPDPVSVPPRIEVAAV